MPKSEKSWPNSSKNVMNIDVRAIVREAAVHVQDLSLPPLRPEAQRTPPIPTVLNLKKK
jgi:hypothetical protein